MNTRRKFLVQGGLAATAALTAKPFNSIASLTSPLTGTDFSNNKFLLLHTSNNEAHTFNRISTLSRKFANVLLVHSGEAASHAPLKFDVTHPAASGYQVLHKGEVKIGIVHTDSSVTDVVSDINTRAAYLKKERDCNFVVCVSSLEAKGKVNDKALAERSSGVDLIISRHHTNYCGQPFIILNRENHEVIIDNAAGKEEAIGSMAVSFCSKGLKSQLAF